MERVSITSKKFLLRLITDLIVPSHYELGRRQLQFINIFVRIFQDYGYTRMKAHNKTHLYFEQVSDEKNGQIIDSFWVVKDNIVPSYAKLDPIN